ncbi:hypothetical protein [Jeotgalibacillus campisalis]|uniref:Uncharacterized protein n=1 Tax=Jeotgalibacillus campisalis TaxID=220754 RepID=A0A0C2VU19_9BACL|nr:hypothetical protein [Jeotgalibacillus campisalis]KIL47478.1 hypothetical protein KR50_16450 [Jeotgalibacillus campisalis]
MKTYKNKFMDGEQVLLNEKVVTIKQWSYVANMKRYSYIIQEDSATFYFEEELRKIQ